MRKAPTREVIITVCAQRSSRHDNLLLSTCDRSTYRYQMLRPYCSFAGTSSGNSIPSRHARAHTPYPSLSLSLDNETIMNSRGPPFPSCDRDRAELHGGRADRVYNAPYLATARLMQYSRRQLHPDGVSRVNSCPTT